MRYSYRFILSIFSLLFFISCSNQDTEPEDTPDLPVLTNIKVAQSSWEPQWILVAYDTVSNSIGISASSEDSYWSMTLVNNTEPKIDLQGPFNSQDYSLIYPDEFRGKFGKKNTGPDAAIWRANKVEQLVLFEISEKYEDLGKSYCTGRFEFYCRGDEVPFTLKVEGVFENVRIFDNAQDVQAYKIQIQLKLLEEKRDQ